MANNGVHSIFAEAKQFVEWSSVNCPHRAEVEVLLAQDDVDELRARFRKRIAFGTAGLRAAMKGGYTFMNALVVLQTSQGLAKYAMDNLENAKSRGIIIGYDGRHHSKSFADVVAKVFRNAGFKIYTFDRISATPLIPFGVMHYKAACGVMVTASHNPKEDNGYKVYWANGAQIIPPQDKGISNAILNNLKPWSGREYEVLSSEEDVNCTEEITKAYFGGIQDLCWTRPTNADALEVVFTAMHGVGGYWMTKAFESFGLKPFIPVKEQIDPDPEFSTVKFPNPEEGKGSLQLALETADRSGSSIVLANDPDSDRLAVAEKQKDGEWRPFNGNEIALLLADWAFVNWSKNNPDEDVSKVVMVASTVSSKILASMAQKRGFQFIDTLTGFKWIGNMSCTQKEKGNIPLFGYEVEIGFTVGDISYDKDGLRAGVVFVEMVSDLYNNRKINCSERLEELYQELGYFYMIPKYFFSDSSEVLDRIYTRLRSGFDGTYPNMCGEFKVTRVRDVTTGFDSGMPDKKTILPTTPESQMITFFFENDVATIRNSGTEPKIKYYIEAKGDTLAGAKRRAERLAKALIDNFIQPKTHGLKSKK